MSDKNQMPGQNPSNPQQRPDEIRPGQPGQKPDQANPGQREPNQQPGQPSKPSQGK